MLKSNVGAGGSGSSVSEGGSACALVTMEMPITTPMKKSRSVSTGGGQRTSTRVRIFASDFLAQERATAVAVGSKNDVIDLIDKYKHKTMAEPTTTLKTKRRRLQMDTIPDVEEGSSAMKIQVLLPNQIQYHSNISVFDTNTIMTSEERQLVTQMTSLMPKFGANLLHKDDELTMIKNFAAMTVGNHANRFNNYQNAYGSNVKIQELFNRMERGELQPPEYDGTPIVKEVQSNIALLNMEAEVYYNFAKLLVIDAEREHSVINELEARNQRLAREAEQQRMEIERLQNEVGKNAPIEEHNAILFDNIVEIFFKYYGTYQKMYAFWKDPSEENRNAAGMEMRSIRDLIIKRCGGKVTLLSVPASLVPP